MKEIFTDKKLEKEFQKKGYIKVPFLNDDEINFILSEYKNLHPDSNFEAPENSYGMTFHASGWDTNRDYRKKVSSLVREVFKSAMNRLVPKYKIVLPSFFVKPSKKGKLGPHQDIFLSSDINDTVINIWCPLNDSNDSNGTLQVVEGSHNIMPNIPNLNAPSYYFNDFFDSISDKYSRTVSVKAGESVIFDTNLIHLSKNNNSNSNRYAVQALCIPHKSTPVLYYLDANTPNENLELIEITKDFFIENTMPELMSGKMKGVNSLGFVKHRNKTLSEEVFVRALKSGVEIKPNTEINESPNNEKEGASFFERVKTKMAFAKNERDS